jgi:hypothetical protein
LQNELEFEPARPIILDIGGEGRHPEAWNLNPRIRKTVGSQRGELIPLLIRGRGESIPLADGIVDALIVERTPLRVTTLTEMLRVARPMATIVLRHANAHRRDPHHLAVRMLKGIVQQRPAMIGQQAVQETVIQLEGCSIGDKEASVGFF